MEIALLQPHTDNLEPPLSLAYLAGPLKKAGHGVRILDLQVPEVRPEWEKRFVSHPVDLVGITSMTPQIHQAHEIAARVKAIRPGVPVAVGGAHPSLMPEQTLLEFPSFDLAVLGEGENTILEIADRLARRENPADESVQGIAYRAGGRVEITKRRPRIADLDSLPNPHDHYDFDYYLRHNSFSFTERSVSMIVSRGCPYSCRFCATKNFWTRKYISKSTAGVIDEIRYLIGKGAEGVVFRDSTFTVNRNWVWDLCEKIRENRLRFKWAINARVDQVEPELFRLMKKTGLDTVYFGVESGSQRILDYYGKGITLQQTEKAFEICRDLRIRTGAYFMLGVLPETREDMEMTYRFVRKLRPSFSLVFLFMPLPGSELYEEYVSSGHRFDYRNIRSDKAALSCPGIDFEELESLRRKWYQDFNPKKGLLERTAGVVLEIRSLWDLKRLFRKISRRFHAAS